MNSPEDILVLNAVAKVTNRMARKCVESAQSRMWQEDEIFSAKAREDLQKFPRQEFLEKELDLIEKHNVKVVTYWDDEYPATLKQIPDAPILLYVTGDPAVLARRGLAIVGCRKSSIYGMSTARQFGLQLAERGLAVFSGLARGIDTAAHQGALAGKGATVAVLGSGLANIYPRENDALAEKISEYGAVISEFPMQTPPFAYNFPRRNRIVSGLSQGVIVIEAAAKSGALITADCALEQGREVYALPGRITEAQAAGTNNLIRQGAKIVTSLSDVLEDLNEGGTDQAVHSEKPKNRLPLSDEEQMVFDYLHAAEPKHFDQIYAAAGQSYGQVTSLLMQLEMRKQIKQLPGKLYIRTS